MGLGSCLVLFGTHLRMASRLFLYVVFPDCVISFSSSDWWMGFLWALFSSLWGLSLLPFWEVAGLLVLGLMLTPWLEASAGGMMQEGALTLGGCMWSLMIRTPSTCEETHDRISSEEPP